MGTIIIGGMPVIVPDIVNVITISKGTDYVVNVNGGDLHALLIKSHLTYHIEIYNQDDILLASGNPPDFNIIINGVTYNSFTTLVQVEAKLVELILTNTSGINISGFRLVVRGGILSIDKELTTLGFNGTESVDDGTTGDWINIKTF
jgi:hypothetical protein